LRLRGLRLVPFPAVTALLLLLPLLLLLQLLAFRLLLQRPAAAA
jgi:hypothetical protein